MTETRIFRVVTRQQRLKWAFHQRPRDAPRSKIMERSFGQIGCAVAHFAHSPSTSTIECAALKPIVFAAPFNPRVTNFDPISWTAPHSWQTMKATARLPRREDGHKQSMTTTRPADGCSQPPVGIRALDKPRRHELFACRLSLQQSRRRSTVCPTSPALRERVVALASGARPSTRRRREHEPQPPRDLPHWPARFAACHLRAYSEGDSLSISH